MSRPARVSSEWIDCENCSGRGCVYCQWEGGHSVDLYECDGCRAHEDQYRLTKADDMWLCDDCHELWELELVYEELENQRLGR